MHPGIPVEVELRASLTARWAIASLLLLSVVHGVQQALQGAPLAALAVSAASLAGATAARRWLWSRAGHVPCGLKLTADGSIAVRARDGSWRDVHLQSGSVRLGGWLVLHLRATDGSSFRLVLGPDNLEGAALAALRRRLRRPPVGTGALL